MKLVHIVGARPNFPKLAPVLRAGNASGVQQIVVHTGQHYDDSLSGSFFRDLDIREPDINLAVGSDSHAVQTARIMERLEPVLRREQPDWVVLYGDVNSTLAGAVVASKLLLRVAHVEAGLRSGDRTMPEEINRIVTDRLADLLLTPSRDAGETLLREGEPAEEIQFVGNVMIDSLFHARERVNRSDFSPSSDVPDRCVLVTLHRPSNVDDPDRLRLILHALRQVASDWPLVFPAHPRTVARIADLSGCAESIGLREPMPYLDMVYALQRCCAVITDSGGLQEETTALGIPCFTLRPNTERPITVTEGTNELVQDPALLPQKLARTPARRPFRSPEGWDGRAGERIIAALQSRCRVKIPGNQNPTKRNSAGVATWT